MALGTLARMASGGICDQVGGGFARYAVDRTWTVPHFEKMLYDNALLARAYLHGFQVSGDTALRRTCEETLEFLARELRGPEGGFLSALDADSEGVEGKFYVWTLDELRDVLGADADAAIAWFGATPHGNFPEFPGANVLEARGPEPAPEVRDRIRAALLMARTARVRPGLDDKRLTSWNALAIAAFAEAGAVLEREDLLEIARGAARFVLAELRGPDGRLLRTWKDGRGRLNAYLEDHAFLLEALLVLYQATFEPGWFAEARAVAEQLLERFADPEHGGFFSTASDHEALVARRKDLEDHPIPAGASSAALGLLRLAALTGEHRYEEAAAGTCACCTRSRRAIPARSGTSCRRSTCTSPPCARSPSPATTSPRSPGRARDAAPARGARGRAGRRRAAAGGPHARRRARGRVRVRALRLPPAGHRARGAARPARRVSPAPPRFVGWLR